MKAYLLSVGCELLNGFISNTNAAQISRLLADEGIATAGHLVLSDTKEELLEALAAAGEKAPVVIVTGGLGPTCDDKTREAVADYFDAPLVFDEQLFAKLQSRYSGLTSLKDQATVPKGALLLDNKLGTASGLYFKKEEVHYFFLPGVPEEMKALFKEELLPRLLSLRQGKIFHLWRSYLSLIESDIDPLLRKIGEECPELEIGIYPKRGIVVVHLSAEEEASLRIAGRQLDESFSSHCIATERMEIEEVIQKLFVSRGKTLSLAESCTGGAIAARLTALPGASDYFFGSVVAYSNSLKSALLGVDPQLLEKHGAVSREAAIAMVQGLLARTHTDWGIAVTGIAGPGGGSEEKPVGTVWVALASKKGAVDAFLLKGRGNREMVVAYAVNRSLGELYQREAGSWL